MSGTKRTPIARIGTALQITPRALELFAATEKASRQRQAASSVIKCAINVYGLCKMECDVCQAWADAHDELHQELRLRPWQWPCLPFNPYPPGSPAFRDWEPSGPELRLWEVLDERARAQAPDASVPSAGTRTSQAAE